LHKLRLRCDLLGDMRCDLRLMAAWIGAGILLAEIGEEQFVMSRALGAIDTASCDGDEMCIAFVERSVFEKEQDVPLNPKLKTPHWKQDTLGLTVARSAPVLAEAGFRPIGHLVFRKTYSSKSTYLRYRHEQAYLLAKGRPPLPKQPLADVMEMPYSGNKLHPTQKPVAALARLIRSFSLLGEAVLDPFAGSGSTCAAALLTGRKYIGVELDSEYCRQANARLARVKERIEKRSSSKGIGIPTM